MKKNKNKPLTVIGVLTIIIGVVLFINSLPKTSLYFSIKRGAVLTDTSYIEITNVFPNSPAEQAQLEKDDIIISINEEGIDSTSQVIKLFEQYEGIETNVAIDRSGELITTTLTPRVNPPVGQGRAGIAIAQKTETKDMPMFKLVPYQITRSYMGYEEVPVPEGIQGGPVSLIAAIQNDAWIIQKDNGYNRLKLLVYSITTIAAGYGLLKRKRWGYYMFLVLSTLYIFNTITTLYLVIFTDTTVKAEAVLANNMSTYLLIYLLFLVITLLTFVGLSIWMYRQRKQFK